MTSASRTLTRRHRGFTDTRLPLWAPPFRGYRPPHGRSGGVARR
ncbi:hypothetical protein MMEU_1712 [Mycobacterium marinum str. Europe]|nr:hypothetical protein MMEU_1712 [Mycobacterium marinum str. Europe]